MILSKSDLRSRILNVKQPLDDQTIKIKSSKIIDYLMKTDIYRNAKNIMTYLSFPTEVQTDTFVTKALEQDKVITVPVCDQTSIDLIPSRITSLSMVKRGYFGIREPEKKDLSPVDISMLDLILIPGVAFDNKGNRIGNGKGYYDNFLRKIPIETPKIALAFELQVINNNWQVDDWDVPVDVIITEEGIRYTKNI